MYENFLKNKLNEKNRLFDYLRQLNKKRDKIKSIVISHAQWVDNLIKEYLIDINMSKKDLCVIALGGYGRTQLNPYSDIDLMFLTNNQINDVLIKDLYDIFYYLGYSCSISTRSLSECVDLSKQDDTIKTSLYDSRFLYGNVNFFKQYYNVLVNDIIKNQQDKFIEAKLQYMENRYKKYGNTIFVLEPNVKEGVGALRDYHTLLWIGKTLFLTKNMLHMKKQNIISSEDYSQLRSSLYFLWQLRNTLHFVTSKKTDILHLDLRDIVASEIGYEASKRFSAQERLMRKYYYHARYMSRIVKKYTNTFLNREQPSKIFFINNNISLSNNTIMYHSDKLDISDTFHMLYYSALYNADISTDVLDKAKKDINANIRKHRKDTELSFIFRNILSLKKPIAKTVRIMHETGLIDKYIPEFGNICCLSEYSLYHKYTVDEHSIQALEHLDSLYNFDIPKTFLVRMSYLWKNLKPHDRFILRLSVLLHDIGKIEKKNHEIVGAKLSKHIAKRLKIGKDLESKMVFLIENHLFMNKIISSRDLEDPKTLKDFVEIVNSKNKLDLLSLLSYADMKAVNDNVWNSWKESLMETLYIQSTYYFENKNYDEFIKFNARESKRRIRLILGEEYENLIEEFPDNIFKDIKTENATKYIKNIQDTKKSIFIYKTERGTDKLLVYYKNEFGLFHKISGVLACFDINIISAKSYNLKNRMIVDIFDVNMPKNSTVNATEIDDMLRSANKGNVDLNRCISSKRSIFLSRIEKAKLEIALTQIDVKVDNSISDLYTAISIHAPDRIGLVYDITEVFMKFKLYVGMFILDTKGTIAVDTFYVVDERFKKIYSTKILNLIESSLYEVLST